MATDLKKYNQKRNFNRTSEPKGVKKSKKTDKSLKFVVQYHIARKEHYDFRLEYNAVLLSWAVPKGPSFNPNDKRLAVHIEDHPLDYANFEGVIPKGEYGGGTVMLWDEGTYAPVENFKTGLKEGSLKFELFGNRLYGKWVLVRMQAKDDKDNWLLIKEKDEYAKKTAGISKFKTSIKTNRTVKEINQDENPAQQKLPFKKVELNLAKLVDKIPTSRDWAFEIKYDGYRAVAFSENGKTKLFSRNNKEFTEKFENIAISITEIAKNRAIVLDGEIVLLDEKGRSDFQALQNHLKRKNDDKTPIYMVFDLLVFDGKDIRNLPLLERKKLLEKLLKKAPSNIQYSEHIIGNGPKFFEEASKLKLEGIIGKKIDSKYYGGRGDEWIKIKSYNSQEFVVGGFSLTDKKSDGISSLLLGVYEKNKLLYVGRVGTGFDESTAKELSKNFKKHIILKSPFKNSPKAKNNEKIYYIKPKFIAEVQFAEWTDENLLRQSSFKGLRQDKSPKDVVLEHIQNTSTTKENENVICGIEISSPNKIIYNNPEIKKIDIARYYEQVADRMLEYVSKRVLSVVRCHENISNTFYKKHPTNESDNVKIIEITNSENEKNEYFYIEDKAGLISQVQFGTLEFHTWGSKADRLEHPDMMVFDLDPDKNLDLTQVRQGVKDLKKVLDSLSLKSFLKTSGGKGYHIVVPFSSSPNWQVFHDFAEKVALLLEGKYPDKYTSNIRKDKREGKIFIDYMRNTKGSTSVAPYSLRARAGAKVSMPIFWSELDDIAPDGIDIFTAISRLKKPDPWKDFYKVKQELK